MTPIQRASGLAILSAMILAAALASCGYHDSNLKDEGATLRAEIAAKEKRLAEINAPAPLTLESLAAGLTQEILRESNNWMVVVATLQQFDKRLQALESKAIVLNAVTNIGGTNYPVIPLSPIPPLQSAPAIPGIEKGKP